MTAATGKAVELAGEPVRDKAKQLYAMLRGRAENDAELAEIEQAPDDAEKARVLEGVIRRAADADPEVRREAEALEALVREATEANAELRRELAELRESVRTRPTEQYFNNFSGTAKQAIQVQKVSGTINIS
ncbi:hypothetical protein [Actinomadura logoneensis]|uniref:hypothetical protein n=1 Tax=Actinomadura logoneensis TaxID=2293572 RepID=UPI0011C18A0E|nr:hypothetical protein [Actinomadura logoneensis]